ncbi:MAG TPA: DUF2336 domain-containing protein [Xanthobacteraceae bacterium]|jgi:uncharacterized protein (DUF2336 family)|nr:DUF2336 domain-containing protein [Xanthobacteraceae bacterium]
MQHASLIDELEHAVKGGSSETRVSTLRRVTDLYLHDANRLNDEQIKVFDDVLCHLADRIEKAALAELGKRLTPIDTAPIGVIKRLASDEEITVSGPVLTGSKRLSTADLIEVARTKGQAHLLAISKRTSLESTLTDVLVKRGNETVLASLANNVGAKFSDSGFSELVERTEGDDALGEIVSQRKDIPNGLLQELLRRATDAVRAKILSLLPPEKRKFLEEVLSKITQQLNKKAEHDYSHAERCVDSLISTGKLNAEVMVQAFAKQRRQDELAVALARFTSAPIKTIAGLLNGQRHDALLVPCKAAGLAWPTVKIVLQARLEGQPAAEKIIALAQTDYAKLSASTALRTLRFMSVH